ncbi:D-2-hydroxyacid dehydrogenase [Salinilacihabitans rarus]|uniref:D-2-hydroxyacid dehydrogenase n=1 Tax=Salinilacihabitans rarus TaxID=2961596 RepID=UPI0020C8DB11|nr:D-2-hydroxyacid dehydrogenase [Salinilacihabitans rarus]
MDVKRLGVHDSVAAVFPPEELADDLADLPVDVAVVGDDGVASRDAVVTLEHREAFRDLAWVHSIQAGVDRFPFDAFEERGVALTNSTGIHGRTVGETVAGYLLAFSRRLHRHVANGTERRWDQPEWDEAFTLPGKSACVVGTGTLGSGVADVVGALGVEISGVRRTPEPVDGFDEIYATDDLHAAIGDADFVVVTLPLTDETEGLFGPAAFEAMDEDAYFVNVGRGPVVDEAALVDAVEAGEIAGAALDVFETEPLPEASPLWGLDEVIVTPHCAAFTRDYHRDVADIVRENVARIDRGEDLYNRVV